MKMNLQENYKRLFKGRIRSNDASILFESPYKVKITDHEINPYGEKNAEKFEVNYNGTIAGPDIPNGSKLEATGVAGDIDDVSAFIGRGEDMSLYIKIIFPDSETSTSMSGPVIYHANNFGNRRNRSEEDLGLDSSRHHYPDVPWDSHAAMTAEKKDELSKIIDDVVVKYALSKGLEDHVAEKSGGTFNKEVAKNTKKKKSKPKKAEKVVVFDGEVDGRNRTASGTYGSKEWELTTDDGMSYIFVDGESIDDDDPMFDAILTTVNDEGYELLDEIG
jgi:hypothetical protein